MGKSDHWSGLVLFIFSAAFCWGSSQLSYGSVHKPGPGFFPRWLGIVLGAMSIGLIVKTTLKKGRTKTIRDLLDEKVRWEKIVIVLLALFLFGLLVDYLGFLTVTFLFMGCLLLFVDRQSWRTVIGWALIGSIGSYLIFEVLLKLRLPKGLIVF